jgi:hypothetical protein
LSLESLDEYQSVFNCSLVVVEVAGNRREISMPVTRLLIAGWAARDQSAAEAHIRELEALGVPRPQKTPDFYHLSRSLLTTAPEIEVMGHDSTGEVECVLFSSGGELFVGVGSDHTDRRAELWGITLAKQLCAKPISPEVWNYRDVVSHWDELVLRSYAISDRGRILYQEGEASLLFPPLELMDVYNRRYGCAPASDTAMFCGTVPALEPIYWADVFCIELYDPVLNRRLTHQYRVRPLAVEGAYAMLPAGVVVTGTGT